jgi:hypothetical protein
MRISDQLAQPKILQKIGKLHSAGMSIAAICQKLRQENGINAGYAAVKSAIRTYSTRGTEILAGDEQLKGEIKEIVLDTKKQLKEINQLIWDLLNTAREQGKLKLQAAINATQEIRKQLEFQEKLLGRMEEGIDYKKMNVVAMTNILVENLTVLQESGYIKILKENPKELIDLEMLKQREEE